MNQVPTTFEIGDRISNLLIRLHQRFEDPACDGFRFVTEAKELAQAWDRYVLGSHPVTEEDLAYVENKRVNDHFDTGHFLIELLQALQTIKGKVSIFACTKGIQLAGWGVDTTLPTNAPPGAK